MPTKTSDASSDTKNVSEKFGHDSPQFFSRWLPALGAFVGITFFAILIWSGAVDDAVQFDVDAHFEQLDAFEGDPCLGPEFSRKHVENGEFFIPIGKRPVDILVTVGEHALAEPLVLMMESSVDRATFTLCSIERKADVQVVGDLVPFSERRVRTENMAFIIENPEPRSRYHLRIHQEAAISQQLAIIPASVFLAESDTQLRVRTAIYSAILMMIGYNFALAYFSGNMAFVFNAAGSFSALALDAYLSGFGSAFVWPEQPWLAQPVLAFGLAGPALFSPFFLAYFLGDDHSFSMRKTDYAWPVLSAIFLISALFFAEIPFLLAITANWIVMTFYYAVRIFRLAMRGSDRANVLLFPLFAAVVPGMVAGAVDSWMQPDFGVLQDHVTGLVLITEALCSTLALAFLMRLSIWREAAAINKLNEQSEIAKRTLLQTIDDDRTRMASELHDTAGQSLLLAVSRFNQIDGLDADLTHIRKDIVKTIEDLRRLSHNLHPSTLDHLGLETALKTLIENSHSSSPVTVSSYVELQGYEFGPTSSLHIYRIVQELITNALTHSGASKLHVDAQLGEDSFMIRVEDNGAGPRTHPTSKGLGSTIVQERVQALGGTSGFDTTQAGHTAWIHVPRRHLLDENDAT